METSMLQRKDNGIILKSPREIDAMRVAGQLAAEVLRMIARACQPGVTTGELDQICHEYITVQQQAVPAPLNYKGFPKSICTSVNNVVCHGIPGDKMLKDGDIVNIDMTVIKDGWHGDTSKMFQVGKPTIRGQRICDVAYKAMVLGIEMVAPRRAPGRYRPCHPDLCREAAELLGGARILWSWHRAQVFHEDPQVLHYGSPGTGDVLMPGMVFTIEPMVNLGKRDTRLLPDGWTVVTKDRSLSAQWEHTIAVTEDGYDVLTRLPGDPL